MKRDENHIDKLFREGLGSDKGKIPSWEEDWNMLEQQLKADVKRRHVFFWLKTASGIAAIFLLAASWWLISSVKEEEAVQRAHVKKDLPEMVVADDEIRSPMASNAFNDINVSLTPALSLKTMKAAEAEKKTDIPMALFKSNRFIPELGNLETPILALGSVQIPSSLDNSPVDPKIAGPGESNKEITSTRKPRRLSLSISVAPAINGVNSFKDGKVGLDAGVLLAASLTKRWSISTGAIYAKKIYETGFDNYNPIYDVGFHYHPQHVDADCRVLDIPLNLNYELLNRKRNAVTLGVGISSYLMLKESYQFVYRKPNGIDPQSYELINENKHWLSVMNLQAAYERRLNSKIALSIQPYMKIPLNEIGYARVKLRSFGMAVNLKWNLERLKAKKDDENGKVEGF